MPHSKSSPPFRETFGRPDDGDLGAPETRAERRVVWSTVHMLEPIHVETEIRLYYHSSTPSRTDGYSSGEKVGHAFRPNRALESGWQG